MGGGHHHHGGGGGNWGWGPGWGGGWGWDGGGAELVVVEPDDSAQKARDKILAYIASLPEKDRAKAFTKFFGSPSATSGGFCDSWAECNPRVGMTGALKNYGGASAFPVGVPPMWRGNLTPWVGPHGYHGGMTTPLKGLGGCGGNCGCTGCSSQAGLGDLSSFLQANWPFAIAAIAGILFLTHKKQNPARRRRRRR